jgi:hypothetical protein
MSSRRFVTSTLFLVCLLTIGIASTASAQSIPVARADVDRDCTVTRTDASIVSAALNKRTGQPGYSANADVDSNGIINNVDVTFVTRNMGRQVCSTPVPAPTIAATPAPAPNANGWNNTDVTVTFVCTNATSCPGPVTVTAEAAAQVVEQTVSNSAGVSATARVTLNIDKTAPALDLTLPSTVLPGAAVAIPVTAVDLSGLAKTTLLVKRTIASTRAATPFGFTWTVPTAAIIGSSESLEVFGEDRAGNVATVRREVRVDAPDTQAPTLAVSAPATAAPGALVPVVVQAGDDRALGNVLLSRVEGSTTQPIENRTAEPFSFQAVAEIPAALPGGSEVVFTAVATDAAGHTTAGSATVRVVTTVQSTALQITVDPPVSPTFQTSGVITGTIGLANTSVPPPATPIVAAVSPNAGRQGQTLDVVITGINTDFTSLSQANLGPGVSVVSATPTDATHLTVRLSIATDAGVGPRVVAVSTGTREGLLASGFSVQPGVGTVSGRLLNAQGQPVVNAQVCIEGTTICVATGTDGTFTFSGVAVTSRRFVVTAGGYDSKTVAIAVGPNGTATVGDVALVTSNLPPPPPLPNSPPIAPKLAAVLGRGATVLGPGGNPEEFKRLIRDAIIAVGGKEMGVLDANGQQLNPLMVGAGYASLTSAAVDEIADDMVRGDVISLAKLFHIFIGSLQFPANVKLPTLAELINGFQASVNDAWANPSRPDAPLLMLLFNHGRVASASPPVVSFDTQFNALQKNVLTVSFMTFVNRFLPEPPPQTGAIVAPASMVVAKASWGDRLRGIASLLLPRSAGLGSSAASLRSIPPGSRSFVAPRGPRLPASFRGAREVLERADVPYGPTTSAERPPSLMWETVVTGVLPDGGWTAAKNAGKLCDGFLVQLATDQGFSSVDGKSPAGQTLAEDPNAKFLPQPECKTAIELLEILMTSGDQAAAQVGQRYGSFFKSEGGSVSMAQSLEKTFQSQAYKDSFAAAKAQAKAMNIATKSLNVFKGLVEGGIGKVQGAIVDSIFKLEVNLIIESLRPRAPFITKVEQLTDPETNPALPSRFIKITFVRSPNDKGKYDNPDIMWTYELWRGRSGAIAPVLGIQFPADAKELTFVDEVPDDGTYVYRVVGRRQTYAVPEVQVENTFMTKTLDFLGGFFDASIKVGGKAVFGLDTVKTITQPVADILKGLRLQWSDPSEPEQIYVSTRPKTPRPPASLAVHQNGNVFLSIPSLNSIFKVTDGVMEPFAYANFKMPGPIGLAADSVGDLYSDNSASDAEFGGRVFSFTAYNGARNLAGTVNYYSQLIQFAHPVQVQAMAAGPGFFGEELFIADAMNQRITRMQLPRTPGVNTSRNVSQPLASSPRFNFGPSTALAVNPYLGLAVTQGNEVMLVPAPGVVQPLFDVANGGSSPYQNLSGVTYDIYGNMYLSDASLGTLTMVPLGRQTPFLGLAGLGPIDLKKLAVTLGLRRPSDVKLAPNRLGLVFYDGERAFASVRFGMSGQVTNASGTPVAGVDVLVPGTTHVATTDSDGVFVMPNLVSVNESPIVDFTIRYQNRTHSFRKVLDKFKHNIVDVVLPAAPAPVPPPPPSPIPPPPPPPPDPPTIKPSGSETVSVAFDFTIQTAGQPPGQPPVPPPGSVPAACPRAVFLSPGDGVASLSPTTTVTGIIANKHFSQSLQLASVSLVVNGTAAVLPVSFATNYEFTTTATLRIGNNVMTVALPASVLKPIGCADPSLDDAALVTISSSQTIFHDTKAEEVARYRSTAGFDKAVRGIIREGGIPLAGVSFVVPGTNHQAMSDGDGVFQVNLPTDTLKGATSAVDALGDELFTRLGSIVAMLRQERRAESLAALKALLAQAIAIGGAPPPAAGAVDALLGRVLLVEGTARTLIQALESIGGIPDPADINALEALGTQLAATNSNGQIVVRGREYPQLSITVSVQQ